MTTPRPKRRLALCGAALSVVATACGGGGGGAPTVAAPPSTSTTTTSTTTTSTTTPSTTTPATTATTTAAQRALPARVVIPSIGVDAGIGRLGLRADGTMEVPADFAQVGWFTGSPSPGEQGPAVLAGHVDSRSGPAVFYELRRLRAGDEVRVVHGNGTTVRFTVTRTEQHPKDRFPTERVYGPTPRSELRLITCSGEFDRSRRSYLDNTVVYAAASGNDATTS